MRKLHSQIEAYRDVELTEASNMTLGEWLDKWLSDYMALTVRESTMDSYKAMSQHDIKPYQPKHRKPGTGGIYQWGDHLWEGRYSPRGADGKRISRNIYAKTREECEEKLAVMIEEVKAEIAQEKEKRKQQSQSEMVTQ